MFLVNQAMVDLNVGTAGLIALLGYVVVFVGLIALMVVVIVVGKIMVAKKSKAAAPVAAPAAAAAPVPAPQSSSSSIDAPLVGTFYAAPAPDQAPFVLPGDRVSKGQTVCLIEAMKMMSEVPAPCDCVIESVCKSNGELVAFGEPLFRYRPC